MSVKARQALRGWMRRVCRPRREVAEELGISAAYLSQIIHGVRMPSVRIIARIEDVTGIPMRAWAVDDAVVNHNRGYQTQPRQEAEISQ